MKYLFSLLNILILSISSQAQTGFQVAIDDTSASGEYINLTQIFYSSNERLTACGIEHSPTSGICLMTFNNDGSLNWAKQYPIGYSNSCSMAEYDHNYFLTANPDNNFMVIKLDSNGEFLKSWVISFENNSGSGCIVQNNDDLIVCGSVDNKLHFFYDRF